MTCCTREAGAWWKDGEDSLQAFWCTRLNWLYQGKEDECSLSYDFFGFIFSYSNLALVFGILVIAAWMAGERDIPR